MATEKLGTKTFAQIEDALTRALRLTVTRATNLDVLTEGKTSQFALASKAVNLKHINGAYNLQIFNPLEQVSPNIIDNFYLGGDNNQYANANYFISSKIQVYEGETYTVSNFNSAAGIGTFYGYDGQVISAITADTFTVPANVSYLRLSVLKSSGWATSGMLYKDTTLPSSYVEYGGIIKGLKLDANSVDSTVLKSESVTSDKLDLNAVKNESIGYKSVDSYQVSMATDTNLFDKDAQVLPNIIDSRFYNDDNGGLATSGSYFISSKIRVFEGVEYTISANIWGALANNNQRIHFYDRNDVHIGFVGTATFTPPTNAEYFRTSMVKGATVASCMLLVGSSLPSTYSTYGYQLPKLQMTQNQLALSGNRWLGKKAVFLGDSITQGNQTVGTPFPDLVASNLGLGSFVNYGISGTTVGTGTGSNNPMVTRYTSMDNDADIVVFNGGLNDQALIQNLGVITDTATTSFYGALNTLVVGLMDKYPGKLIIGMSTTPRFNDAGTKNYANAIKEVCAKYMIPCIDLYYTSGMNPDVASSKTAYFGDNLHHNEAGKARLANIISGFIRTQ